MDSAKAVLFFSIVVAFLSIHTQMLQANPLQLSDYLQQVNAQHQGLQSSQSASEAATLRSRESDLALAPTVFASVQQSTDKKPTSNAAFQGTESSVTTMNVGVSKATSFGLNAKLSFLHDYYNIEGANPQFVPTPKYYDARPSLELSQSLWRNFNGREIKAAQALSRAQAMASSATENFKAVMIRLEAEAAYWRLALARETVAVQKASLQRSEKIRAWSSNRARLGLADRSDLLQADAATAAKSLEVRMSEDEVEAASRQFNLLRGSAESNVNETLAAITPEMVDQIKVPGRGGERADITAAKQYAALADASARAVGEKYKPTLELFAVLALNGKDTAEGKAVSQSFGSEYPTTAVGLRISAPIGASVIDETRRGYKQDAAAAEAAVKFKEFEQDQEWKNLENKLNQSKERLRLIRSLEAMQKQKLDYERDRQQRGRSTMYQVINYEQDFANTQLSRIKSQAELLSVVAQMATFGGAR